jgi:hypothetical protein
MPEELPLPARDHRGMHLWCPACDFVSHISLDGLVLWLPQAQRFWRAHPRVHKLPDCEVEAAGRPAVVTRLASVDGAARLDVVSASDTYEVLHVDACPAQQPGPARVAAEQAPPPDQGAAGRQCHLHDRHPTGRHRHSVVRAPDHRQRHQDGCGAALALVPALSFTVGLEYWQLLVLIVLANFFDIPGTTARSALLLDLAELAGKRFERAGSALQAIERGSRLVGASAVLWIDAATFIVSALLVALAVPRIVLARSEETEHARGQYLRELWGGLRFLLRSRLVLAIVLIAMLMNFVDVPFGGVVLPVYVLRSYRDPLALGLMVAASGLGAVVGALLFGAIGHRLPRRGVFLLGLFVVTARYTVLTLPPPLAVVLGVQLFTGLAAGPFNPIISTISTSASQRRCAATCSARRARVPSSRCRWVCSPADCSSTVSVSRRRCQPPARATWRFSL